jgi:hypothetical protein
VVSDVALRWALTGVFLASIALYARQAVGAGSRQQRFGWWLHVLMAAAMIAMAWPAGMSIPTLLYVLVFTAAALYFVYFAVFGPRLDHTAYHAVMMAAMVAMAVVMPAAAMPTISSAAAMGSDAHMSMAGMASGHAGGAWAPPAWVSVTCGLATAGFLGAALWLFIVLIRGPRRGYADLLMSLGMGLAFATVAI